MNSRRRSLCPRGSGGFTLLETVIVLGLISVIIGWVVVSVGTVETEDRLRRAVGDFESMAKRARSVAVSQQRPYQLTISAGGISMAPVYPMRGAGEEGFGGGGTANERFEDVAATEKPDPGVTYEIKRWRSDVWQVIEGDEKVVLTLDPVGLVEPVSIRCSVGKSWIIQELHPLTAGIRDEEMSIEKE